MAVQDNSRSNGAAESAEGTASGSEAPATAAKGDQQAASHTCTCTLLLHTTIWMSIYTGLL